MQYQKINFSNLQEWNLYRVYTKQVDSCCLAIIPKFQG